MEINYRDQTVAVDQHGVFRIKWNESIIEELKLPNDISDRFDTLQKAKDLIDTNMAILKKKSPLRLAVLSHVGVPLTITGIHLGTHNILVSPSSDIFNISPIYIDHPNVRERLARLQVLKKEEGEIRDALSVCKIKTSFGFGRMGLEDYETYIAQLNLSYAAAKVNIEGSSPE